MQDFRVNKISVQILCFISPFLSLVFVSCNGDNLFYKPFILLIYLHVSLYSQKGGIEIKADIRFLKTKSNLFWSSVFSLDLSVTTLILHKK